MLATTNASGVLLELTVPQDPLCLSLRHRFFTTGALRRHANCDPSPGSSTHVSVSLGPLGPVALRRW